MNFFVTSKDAPNEGTTAPETAADRLRYGKQLYESRAVPKWEEFQRNHKGEALIFQSPVVGASEITSGFGHRKIKTPGASEEHAGVDMGARGGNATPNIVASAAGIVLFAGSKSGYGNTVIIGHANGSFTLYGHMSDKKMPALGAEVKQGQQIGVMSATGLSDGVHLHYEQHVGDAVVAPKIAGVVLTKGLALAGAPVVQDSQFAVLVDVNKLPKLPVANGGKPNALGFANAIIKAGTPIPSL